MSWFLSQLARVYRLRKKTSPASSSSGSSAAMSESPPTPWSITSMANSAVQFLRLPVLASSGLAVVASGVLYFKQKYDITIRLGHYSFASRSWLPAVNWSTRAISPLMPVPMCPSLVNLASRIMRISRFLRQMGSRYMLFSSGRITSARRGTWLW